jgi:hypothetical protein
LLMGWAAKSLELRDADTGELVGTFNHKRAVRVRHARHGRLVSFPSFASPFSIFALPISPSLHFSLSLFPAPVSPRANMQADALTYFTTRSFRTAPLLGGEREPRLLCVGAAGRRKSNLSHAVLVLAAE